MTASDHRCWHVPGAAQFIWRDLQGVVALHDRRSGETHLLDALSQQILEMLSTAPQDAEGLAQHLLAPLGAAGEELPAIRQRVGHTLAEFDRLGLIAPVPHHHRAG